MRIRLWTLWLLVAALYPVSAHSLTLNTTAHVDIVPAVIVESYVGETIDPLDGSILDGPLVEADRTLRLRVTGPADLSVNVALIAFGPGRGTSLVEEMSGQGSERTHGADGDMRLDYDLSGRMPSRPLLLQLEYE